MVDNTLERLEKELPLRRRQQARVRARLIAIRWRLKKVKRGIARRIKPPVVPRPHEMIQREVRNQSARSSSIKLIVLHDTEGGNVKGAADLSGVVGWFDNPKSQASAHVVVDAEGQAARCVRDDAKAWHCAQFNSVALGIEQIGFASQAAWPDEQLRTVAQYIAHWSQRHKIPLVFSTSHGVCEHRDLGSAGGGHTDCGPSYPFERVLGMARIMVKEGV